MKELKQSKSGMIVLYVIVALFFVIGIVALILPDEAYDALGVPDPDVSRYMWFILFEFIAFVTLIKTLILIPKRKRNKRLIDEYNRLRKQMGENAFFVSGYCKAINKDNSDAIKTAVSVLGATASALLFGIGVYKIYSTNNMRLFLVSDEGVHVICSPTGEKLFLKKGSITTATLTETPKGQIELTCPNENFVLTFATERIDMDNNVLAQKLQELFFDDQATSDKA